MNKTLAKKIREAVLEELDGRGGFDSWFGNIDDEIQDEIKEALDEKIESLLDDGG